MRKFFVAVVLLLIVMSVFCSSFAQPEVGEIIEFGQFEQDNDPADGPEPIKWQVLAAEDGRSLLISVYGLDTRSYNDDGAGVMWDTCSLRSWLNGEFLENAFSSSEKDQITETDLESNNGKGKKVSTKDFVFLLDSDETEKYLGRNDIRLCEATPYAAEKGAWISKSNGFTTWWLREPGYCACEVTNMILYGFQLNDSTTVVRPAIWIRN